MLSIIKTYLGFTDLLQDDVLLDIIDTYTKRVKTYIGSDTLPAGLEWIVKELTIVRYNRIGSEGNVSESEEGKSITYKEDDPFKGFIPELDKYLESQSQPASRGKAKFL